MIITSTPNRRLELTFDDGNYLLEEEVKEGECKITDTVWLTSEEIEKINEFKQKMTGEIA